MKFKIFIRSLCVILCVVLLTVTFCSCSAENKADIKPMEIEEVDTYGFDFLGGDDVMPIMGYIGGMNFNFSYNGQVAEPSISDSFMSLVAESGVNSISNNGADYNVNPQLTKKLLDLGLKYGIGITVMDKAISEKLDNSVLDEEHIGERITNYIDHPACVGIYIQDEPYPDYYVSSIDENTLVVRNQTKSYNALAKYDLFVYGSLFPMNTITDKERYEAYVAEFTEKCPTKALLYDKYPFWGSNELEYAPSYFSNMESIRKYAEKSNIPFWPFIQAGSQWNDAGARFDTKGYWPDEGSFNWIASTSLAFGAKGIMYFPLEQPYWFPLALTTKYDFQRNGIIGAWGNKTRFFYYAQNVNKQIKAVDHILMNSVNKGLICTDQEVEDDLANIQYVLKGKSWRELKNVEGKALIGCFNYQGKTALYVSNYDNIHNQNITLDFYDEYKVTVIQEGETSHYKTDTLLLTMIAGDGALVVFE